MPAETTIPAGDSRSADDGQDSDAGESMDEPQPVDGTAVETGTSSPSTPSPTDVDAPDDHEPFDHEAAPDRWLDPAAAQQADGRTGPHSDDQTTDDQPTDPARFEQNGHAAHVEIGESVQGSPTTKPNGDGDQAEVSDHSDRDDHPEKTGPVVDADPHRSPADQISYAAVTNAVIALAEPPLGSDPTDPDELRAVPGARMIEVLISDVRANAAQPRTVFDEDALSELAHSIREFGLLQPIVVREAPDGRSRYELVMGERRLRAAVVAGLESIPAILRDTADDAMLRDALLENIHRASLNPLEEAAAYQQLLEEFGATHDELAQRIGRSRSQVSNTIRLLNLPVAVQRRVAAGVLSAGHARALLGLADAGAQEELAIRIVAEGLSVRATEELVTLAALDGAPRAARRPTRTFTAPALTELAGNLSDVFDTRVRVDLGRRKGKITVEFATIDDLERIVAVMAPELATKRPTVQPDVS